MSHAAVSDAVPFNRLKACRHGQMLYNQHDTYIGRSLDLYGEYSAGEVELFHQIVRPGNVVVEVGANIGAHTVCLAQLVTQRGVVVAFEPQRILFQTLCANIALNNLRNVFCFQQAVGSQASSIVVPPLDYTRENNFGGVALGRHQQGEQVPLAPLDQLNLGACHLLKVDVEGMELDVLQGAKAMIARFQPILYVENDREDKAQELMRYIDSIGYKMYWHRPYYFNPNNFLGNPQNVFPNIVSINLLCVPKSMPQEVKGFEPAVVV